MDTHKNHKQWYQHTKRLINNPSLIEDLGEKLYETIDAIVGLLSTEQWKNIDYIAGIEARGFIFSSAIAYKMQIKRWGRF